MSSQSDETGGTASSTMLVSERLLSTKQAADILGVSPRTVQKLIKEEALPAYQVGKKFRVPPVALNMWLSQRRVT